MIRQLIRHFSTAPRSFKQPKPPVKHVTGSGMSPSPMAMNSSDRRPRTAYNKQHAAHLLSKIIGEPVSMDSLGPTTNDDLKYIPLVKNNRSLLYTILGTSENQLMDSVIVDRTVKRFLDRDQIEKALMMCRLAKEEGVVAMNRVHNWYFDKGKVNDCLELYAKRKKYGVPPNGAALTTLFDGCANAKTPLTVLQVKKLERIITGAKDIAPNYSHIHSAFQAMLNCEDKSIAIDLFNRWHEEPNLSKKVPTVQLYTILIEGMTQVKDDLERFTNIELIWAKVLEISADKKDPIIYESYISAYVAAKRLDLVARGFEAASMYFHIVTTTPKIMAENTRFIEPEGEKIRFPNKLKSLKRKYHPSQRLIDLLMKTYMALGDYRQASDIFTQFESSGRVNDVVLWNRYLTCTMNLHRDNAAELCIGIYDSLKEKAPKLKRNGVMRWLVFNSIYTESLTALNDKGRYVIGSRANDLFELSTRFLHRFKVEEITAQDVDGYLKSIRRLRLTKDQRQEVLELLESKHGSFDAEFKTTRDKKKLVEYIKGIEKSEKFLRGKQEMKLALQYE